MFHGCSFGALYGKALYIREQDRAGQRAAPYERVLAPPSNLPNAMAWSHVDLAVSAAPAMASPIHEEKGHVALFTTMTTPDCSLRKSPDSVLTALHEGNISAEAALTTSERQRVLPRTQYAMPATATRPDSPLPAAIAIESALCSSPTASVMKPLAGAMLHVLRSHRLTLFEGLCEEAPWHSLIATSIVGRYKGTEAAARRGKARRKSPLGSSRQQAQRPRFSETR